MDPHPGKLTLVVPASAGRAELVRTLTSLRASQPPEPVPVIVAFAAQHLDVPGVVATVFERATCLAVAGSGTWGELANAGAAHANSPQVAWVVPGMPLAAGWAERIRDRMAESDAEDHRLDDMRLWGSAMEVLVADKPESAPWPENLGEHGADSFLLVQELAHLLAPAAPRLADDRSAEPPPHAAGFRHDLDAVGARLADVIVERRTPPAGMPRQEWSSWGIERDLTSIVILTCNQLDYTRRCLDSLRTHTPQPHEIIVVDNGSTDGSLDYLRNQEDVLLVENGANHGFAGGCNQGLAICRGDAVLFLNNDTVVTEGWLAPLRAEIALDEVGVVGPRSNRVVGQQLVDNVGYDQQTLDGLDDWAAQFTAAAESGSERIIRAIGFCMLVHRKVIDLVGGFDLAYGIGNLEDDDICLRAQIAGYEVRMSNRSFVHHFGGATFSGENVDYEGLHHRNWAVFTRKWQFPEGGVDWSRMRYVPASVTGRPFDPAKHWNAPWPVPQRAVAVDFDSRMARLHIPADWARPGEFAEAVQAVLETLGSGDDVTVVIRADAGDEAIMDALELAADRVHDGALPDVVVVPAGASAAESVYGASTHVLAYGSAASTIAQTAHRLGAHPVRISDLHSNFGKESTWHAA